MPSSETNLILHCQVIRRSVFRENNCQEFGFDWNNSVSAVKLQKTENPLSRLELRIRQVTRTRSWNKVN